MTTTTVTSVILTASEGKILTDGEVFGKVIYPAADRSADEFHEIDISEYNEIKGADTDERD